MKILVLGSGGREHALGWKLARSPLVKKLYFAPGNGGTALLGENLPCGPLEVERLVALARELAIDLTVVGPDDALALGVVDAFEAAGLKIFGPTAAAARLESSKSFAKDFMVRHGIPCARSETFTDSSEAHRYCLSASYPLVIKADGLALGKGVILAANPQEAAFAIHRSMDLGVFGQAGKKIIIEEFLTGPECSIHAFVAGGRYLLCPDCRDHKRAHDGDLGPNTGGMGTISPSGSVDDALGLRIEEEILQPFVRGLLADGIDFRGMLFPGLMLTPTGPKVLEFNCRFGDPETQVLMRRLESDLPELLLATVEGRLESVNPVWSSDVAACVVMASGGYPGGYQKGYAISGLEELSEQAVVFHAGTKREADRVVTSGGRVLGVTATAGDLPGALGQAYAACERIHFENAFYRRDIGASS